MPDDDTQRPTDGWSISVQPGGGYLITATDRDALYWEPDVSATLNMVGHLMAQHTSSTAAPARDHTVKLTITIHTEGDVAKIGQDELSRRLHWWMKTAALDIEAITKRRADDPTFVHDGRYRYTSTY